MIWLKVCSHWAISLRTLLSWRAKWICNPFCPSQCPSKRSKVPPVNVSWVVRCKQALIWSIYTERQRWRFKRNTLISIGMFTQSEADAGAWKWFQIPFQASALASSLPLTLGVHTLLMCQFSGWIAIFVGLQVKVKNQTQTRVGKWTTQMKNLPRNCLLSIQLRNVDIH